ncbi:unnamed protein product [Staurois parvus]|uniref:Uncharacterized protein n=1 Tax=Staurois parvus TaxID=386267 RepID=A0ABN9F5P1_9NEOB|nr:unnamed protein product [Staurois parvus]
MLSAMAPHGREMSQGLRKKIISFNKVKATRRSGKLYLSVRIL